MRDDAGARGSFVIFLWLSVSVIAVLILECPNDLLRVYFCVLKGLRMARSDKVKRGTMTIPPPDMDHQRIDEGKTMASSQPLLFRTFLWVDAGRERSPSESCVRWR